MIENEIIDRHIMSITNHQSKINNNNNIQKIILQSIKAVVYDKNIEIKTALKFFVQLYITPETEEKKPVIYIRNLPGQKNGKVKIKRNI